MPDLVKALKDWYLDNLKYGFQGDSYYGDTPFFQNRTTRAYGRISPQSPGTAGSFIPGTTIGESITNRLKYGFKPDMETLHGLDSMADLKGNIYSVDPAFAQDTMVHSHEAAHDIFNRAKFSQQQIEDLTKLAGKDNADYFKRSSHYSDAMKSFSDTVPDESLAYAVGDKSPSNQIYVNQVASRLSDKLKQQLLLLNERAKKK